MLAAIEGPDEEELKACHLPARHAGASVDGAERRRDMVRGKTVSVGGFRVAGADLLEKALQAGRLDVLEGRVGGVKRGAGALCIEKPVDGLV
jgi:hypothetical protein